MLAAIDFGISNTDAVALIEGRRRFWTQASDGLPDERYVSTVLAGGGLALDALPKLAVTGGRHRVLSGSFGRCEVVAVPEITAIGRGGQALGLDDDTDPATPVLVVSAGSGTAVVTARDRSYTHITGTGVGGGTLLGLGRLLLATTDPTAIDAMALRGDANGADLALRDVVSGPIGALPPDATAVNFGRLARHTDGVAPDDLAAALVTLVGQVIAITAINAARAEAVKRIVVIGHMTDMASFRRVLGAVGAIYGTPIIVPEQGGFGTALGALLHTAG